MGLSIPIYRPEEEALLKSAKTPKGLYRKIPKNISNRDRVLSGLIHPRTRQIDLGYLFVLC
jgi:hypothetical protein